MTQTWTYEKLLEEYEALRQRVEENEATVEAIRRGEVDAVVVYHPFGEAVYSLEQADQPYRFLIEAMQQGAATVQRDGTILYCNRCFAEMLGRTQDEVIGRRLASFAAEDEGPLVESLLVEAAAERARGELRLRRGDRETFPADLLVHALPFRRAMCVILGDLTRQRQYEQLIHAKRSLAESEERLRLALENTNTGLWELDCRTERVRYTSIVGDLFALPPDVLDSPADRFRERVLPEDLPRIQASQDACVAGETTDFECEFRVRLPEGGVRWILARGRVHLDGSGSPARLLGTAVDISRLKASEEVLKEADRRKDEFLASFAHEVRNPLASIRSALEILRLSEGNRGRNEKAGRIAERQVDHLTRLIEDLVDVTRIRRGTVEFRRERVPLAGVVQQAIETTLPALEAAHHSFRTSIPDEPILLDVDPIRIAQAISNLLHNAARYTPPGGNVWLEVERRDRTVAIRVRDDGIGIPPESLPHIFDLFSQGGGETERSSGGLGIGLSIVKSLVGAHGGSVTVRSDGPNRGSEFVVELPLAP